jgi:hypothetical protein
MSNTVHLPTSATPTLRRLNSRGMARSLPSADAVDIKTHKASDSKLPGWLAPPLAPKLMAPERHSKAADAAVQLHRIQHIEIADVVKHEDDSKNYYVINVYLKQEQSRIPTNQSRFQRVLHAHENGHHEMPHKPDFTIQRRFSEFERLRKDVWDTVQHSHRHFCRFCDGFMTLMLFSSAQPGVLAKTVFRSSEIRAKLLDKFLHNLVAEFQLGRPRCRIGGCYGVGHLPAILYSFLTGSDDDQDEIASARHSATSNPAQSP